MFNPDAVARTLRDANIAFTQTVARRILLVPMSPEFHQWSLDAGFLGAQPARLAWCLSRCPRRPMRPIWGN